MTGDPGVIVIHGPEEFLVAERMQESVKALLDGSDGHGADVFVRKLTSSQVTAAMLKDAASPDLFGEISLLVIAEGQSLAGDVVTELARLVSSPGPLPAIVTMVFAPSKSAKRKAKKPAKPKTSTKKAAELSPLEALREAGARMVEVPGLANASARAAFLERRLRAAGLTVSPQARAVLLDGEPEARGLAMRVTQLVSDLTGDTGQPMPEVSAGAAATVVCGRPEVSGFAVTDAILGGNTAIALTACERALAGGTSAIAILTALTMTARDLAKVEAAQQAGARTPTAIAEASGLPSWKVTKLVPATGRLRGDRLAAWIALLGRTGPALQSPAKVDTRFLLQRAVLAAG